LDEREIRSIMPTVLRVGRFRFFFFSNEGSEPPHIHVKSGADEAKFWLTPVELVANYGFNGRELNEARRIIEQHVAELLEAWNEHFDQ
jgi:Domain of unknown function (DUF4160)